jgi:diguanylate cyclase (GGDEF)-like protein
VLALNLDERGEVWVGHWRGLSRLRGQTWETLELPGLPQGNPVLALARDRDGRLWLGTQGGQLGVVELIQGREQVRWVQSLAMPIQALAEDGEGRLWVGAKAGLWWLDPASGRILAKLRHDPRRSTGLAGNDISGLLRDSEGAMWVTGYGLGLQRHQDHPALAVRGLDADPASPLAEADVRALLTLSSGEVLAPTQTGHVVRLDGRPGQALHTLGRWPRERHSVVESLAQARDGSVWLAAAGRLEHRRADGHLLRDWALDGGRAQQQQLRADGEIWLGMQEGLYRLRSADAAALGRVDLANGQPLQGGIYALMEEPAGRLWVGGQQGLFQQAGPGDGLALLAQSPEQGLGSPVVMALLRGGDGSIWVDTPVSGLHKLIGQDEQGRARFDRISERHGLEGLFGTNLHEDEQGRIWNQLYVYDPRADKVETFGAAEGAALGSYWFFASTRLPDGSLLFGGSRGLLRIQPQAYVSTARRPTLVISALRANAQAVHPANLAQGLSLPPGTRSLGVEFAGLDYADPSRLRYEYRLQGLDSDWTHADASARAPTFGPLKPGRYQLQVRASSALGTAAVAELSLPIELQPQWWQTLWAQLVGAALLALSLWGWVRWRTRRLRQRQQELQPLVDERTAELREASLTDSLTGLRNRRYLALRLDEDLHLCLRRFESSEGPGADADLVLMLLDLDHFKRVNDVHGHAAGDAVLAQVAQRLRQVFRDTDSLVRWGGEEVLVLVRNTQRESAAELAERACAAVRDQDFITGTGQRLRITVSMGFAAFPADPQQPRAWDWSACLHLADQALYAAKARGRDGYVGVLRAQGLRPAELQADLAERLLAGDAAGLSLRCSPAHAPARPPA